MLGFLYRAYMHTPLDSLKNQRGTKPTPRTISFDWMTIKEWMALFDQHNEIAKSGKTQLLFLGDSITENWNKEVWQKYFSIYQAHNFGIGGDHTGNLLWRLQNLESKNLSPKLIVLQIGVNNFGHLNEKPAEVFQGIQKVIEQCKLIMPSSHILLHGILPFGQSKQSPNREYVKTVNTLLLALADNTTITYCDYGELFLNNRENIDKGMMADFLHPTPFAYSIWAKALIKDIKLLLS